MNNCIPIDSENLIWTSIDEKASNKFYYQMRLIRSVEERLLDLFSVGLLSGTVHTCIGQEASAVGLINALDATKDLIFSNHRAHGHYIVYTDDIEGLIAEVMGKKTGACGGIGGSQHLCKRNMYTNGVQGGMVPSAVGAALAEKLKHSKAICVVFLGDGTMGQGTVYEGMNIASLWSLPLLFVLEDNGYAQSTPKRLAHAGDLTTRAATFMIKVSVVQAVDVFEVHDAARRVVQRVRKEKRPHFLVVNTYRLGPHSKGDDTRPVEEIQKLRGKDPLTRISSQLPEHVRLQIDEMVENRVQEAVELALAAEAQTIQEFEEKVGCHEK